MLPDFFAIVGAVIASLGGIYYLYQTILGKAKPNRVTWILWGVFPMVIFVAQRVQHVQSLSWVSFAAGFTPFLVVMASFFNIKAYWKTKPVDYGCMAIGVVGMIIWAITSNPNFAILFSIVADIFAGLPTIIKSYNHPETESWIAYAISTFGFGISVLAIHAWAFQNYAFAVYLFIANALLALLSFRGRLITVK